MKFLLYHEPHIHYLQRRPMRLPFAPWSFVKHTLYSGGSIYSDCSEMVTALYRWAGLKDPNGTNYSGYGSTYTMAAHLPHYYNPRLALPGALVHFVNPDHVSVVYEASPVKGDPLLFSHGSEHGPRLYRMSQERQWHNGPVQFLRVSKL